MTDLLSIAGMKLKFMNYLRLQILLIHCLNSKDQMNFLDTTVYKGARFLENNVLDIKTFIKPTNTYQYLDRNSAHHPSVFKGFIKGETIRYLRNTSDKKILSDMLSELKCNLIKRGYDENEVQDLINDVLNHCNRTDALNNSGKKEDNDIPLVLITAYNPCIRNLKSKLLKYWHILRRDEECKKSFQTCQSLHTAGIKV